MFLANTTRQAVLESAVQLHLQSRHKVVLPQAKEMRTNCKEIEKMGGNINAQVCELYCYERSKQSNKHYVTRRAAWDPDAWDPDSQIVILWSRTKDLHRNSYNINPELHSMASAIRMRNVLTLHYTRVSPDSLTAREISSIWMVGRYPKRPKLQELFTTGAFFSDLWEYRCTFSKKNKYRVRIVHQVEIQVKC